MVLNWNGSKYLRACLESLRPDICPHVEVVAVDNGSTDGSVALVQEEFPELRMVAHAENLGFSRGYNAALPQVEGRLLVFLNNDTEVERGWLAPLVDPLLEYPEVGITASKLLFFRTRMLNSAGGYFKLWTGGGELGFGRDEGIYKDDRPIEPFFASGAAMATRRELFEYLGGFDEGMFAYGEDMDLSWRARLAGYRVWYCPSSVVHHHFSASFKAFNPRKLRMTTRHRIRAMLKCLSLMHLVHALPAYVLFALAKGAALSIVARNPSYLPNAMLALGDNVRTIRDVWRRRRAVQRLRVVSDRKALSSEGFGLVAAPWDLWRITRVAARVSKKTVD